MELARISMRNTLNYQTQVSLQGIGSEPLGLGPSSHFRQRNCLGSMQWKIGTLLLASEMPFPIPRNRL